MDLNLGLERYVEVTQYVGEIRNQRNWNFTYVIIN